MSKLKSWKWIFLNGKFLLILLTKLHRSVGMLGKVFACLFWIRYYGMKLNNNLKIDAGRVKRRTISGMFPNCFQFIESSHLEATFLMSFVMKDDIWQHWLNHFELNLLLILTSVLTDE